MLALGIVLIVLPSITPQLLLRIVGSFFLLTVGMKVYQYFHKQALNATQGWGLSIGIFMVLAALIMIIAPYVLIYMQYFFVSPAKEALAGAS